MEKKFYVYVYYDPRKPGKYKYGEYEFDYEPFYVGKGSFGKSYIDRIDYHWKSLHRYLNEDGSLNLDKIRKFDGNIPKVYLIKQLIDEKYEHRDFCFKFIENLNETVALDKELDLIKNIGRKSLKTGPLYNLTEGGEYHRFVKPWSKGLNKEIDDRLMKISEDRKGLKNPMFGRKQSEKYYKAQENRRGNPSPNHNKYRYKINKNIITDLKSFCQENNIVYSTVLSHFCKVNETYKKKNITIIRIKI